MSSSRTDNSIKNSVSALFGQVIYVLMSFICRTVFIAILGKTYLGFSGLFGNIMSLLALAEGGIGPAVLYSMYDRVSKGDEKGISALMNLYRRAYFKIGIAVTLSGACLIPFLGFFVSGADYGKELPIIYILYLMNASAGYFFVYKKYILIAFQKSYVLSRIFIVSEVLQKIFQIAVLYGTGSFIIYLIIQLIFSFLNNYAVSEYVDIKYPYLQKYRAEAAEEPVRRDILGNIRATFVGKLSSAAVSSTDNLIISAFVSTAVLGLYSNYMLFVSAIQQMLSKIFEGIVGSVGNLAASDDGERAYTVMKRVWFINYWLAAFASLTLYVTVDPFIELWIGKEYLLGSKVVFLICLNLFMRLIRITFLIFNEAYGHFKKLRIKCIAEAVINLVASLIFVIPLKMGLFGVLLGTTLSNLCTNFWYEPYLLYKRMNVSMGEYFFEFLKYTALIIASGVATLYFCRPFSDYGAISFFAARLTAGVFFINAFIFGAYFFTDEFRSLVELIKKTFFGIKKQYDKFC